MCWDLCSVQHLFLSKELCFVLQSLWTRYHVQESCVKNYINYLELRQYTVTIIWICKYKCRSRSLYMCRTRNDPSVKGWEEVKPLPTLWHTLPLVLLRRTICGYRSYQEFHPAHRAEYFWIWISVTDTSLAKAAFPSKYWFVETEMFCEEGSNSASISQNTGSHLKELGPSGRFLSKTCVSSCQRAGNPAQQPLQFEHFHLWAGAGLTWDGRLLDTSGSSTSCQI